MRVLLYSHFHTSNTKFIIIIIIIKSSIVDAIMANKFVLWAFNLALVLGILYLAVDVVSPGSSSASSSSSLSSSHTAAKSVSFGARDLESAEEEEDAGDGNDAQEQQQQQQQQQQQVQQLQGEGEGGDGKSNIVAKKAKRYRQDKNFLENVLADEEEELAKRKKASGDAAGAAAAVDDSPEAHMLLSTMYDPPEIKSRRQAEQVAHIMRNAQHCVNEEYHSKFPIPSTFQILKDWHDIAEALNIRYMLAAGTLFGAATLGGPLPWDLDFDIIIDSRDVEKLRQHGEQPPFRTNHTHVYILPDYKLHPDKRRRFNCEGEEVNGQSDHCSFTEPVGRLIGHPAEKTFHLDLFPLYVDEEQGTGTINVDISITYTLQDLMPTRPCRFWGLTMQCPNSIKSVLVDKYGADYMKFFYEYGCVEGVWKRVIDIWSNHHNAH